MSCPDFIFDPRVADIAKALPHDPATRAVVAQLEERDRMLEDFLKTLPCTAASGTCTCWYAMYDLTGDPIVSGADPITPTMPTPTLSVGTRPTDATLIHVDARMAWIETATSSDGPRNVGFVSAFITAAFAGPATPWSAAFPNGTQHTLNFQSIGSVGLGYTVTLFQENTNAEALAWSLSWTELSSCCPALVFPV